MQSAPGLPRSSVLPLRRAVVAFLPPCALTGSSSPPLSAFADSAAPAHVAGRAATDLPRISFIVLARRWVCRRRDATFCSTAAARQRGRAPVWFVWRCRTRTSPPVGSRDRHCCCARCMQGPLGCAAHPRSCAASSSVELRQPPSSDCSRARSAAVPGSAPRSPRVAFASSSAVIVVVSAFFCSRRLIFTEAPGRRAARLKPRRRGRRAGR